MEQSILNKTLESIDAKIQEWNEDIKRGEALNRLMKNSDFKLVILDGYFEAEATKLFHILTDPSGASEYTVEEIQLLLASISHFKGYVGTEDYDGTIKINADRAPLAIAREENYRKEVTAEAAGE